MGAWTIGVEVRGSRIDADGLDRLVDVLGREFAAFDAECALWSGRLAVNGVVDAPTPVEALERALAIVDLAFDQAEIDTDHRSSIARVTMRDERRSGAASGAGSLPLALLRRLRLRTRTGRAVHEG